MSLTRTEPDACDLVQDTFQTWAEKGGQLQDPSKAKPWLFTTLHRSFLKRHQRLIRFPEVELRSPEMDLSATPVALVERLDGQFAMECLSRVDDPFRTPVALFYLNDCSYLEIAEILDSPLGTVKSRIARVVGGATAVGRASARGPALNPAAAWAAGTAANASQPGGLPLVSTTAPVPHLPTRPRLMPT